MKLSIIIPTIGRPILKEVITSLLPQIQKHPDSKIFISYDGKKNTHKFQKLKDKISQSPQIQIISTEQPRSGAANARNIALQKATTQSDIITFLGDDTVPHQDWLQKTINWHKSNPETNQAVLGRVHWVKALKDDPLHKWLDGHIQFDFTNLDNGQKPDWRHFTTSNLSLKSSLLEDNLFNTNFHGWGFEDGELGYRLHKSKNLQINYAPDIKVFHDHPQTLTSVLHNLSNARQNAKLLQELHPEVKLLPKGIKKIILIIISFLLYPIPYSLSKKAYWWSRSKLVWLGYKFPISDQKS